jgi:hypothetical protein
MEPRLGTGPCRALLRAHRWRAVGGVPSALICVPIGGAQKVEPCLRSAPCPSVARSILNPLCAPSPVYARLRAHRWRAAGGTPSGLRASSELGCVFPLPSPPAGDKSWDFQSATTSTGSAVLVPSYPSTSGLLMRRTSRGREEKAAEDAKRRKLRGYL